MEYTEAKSLGLKRYNTGRPCKKGHLTDRRTSTRTCVQCMYEIRKAWQHNNRDRDRQLNREWKRRNNYGYDEAAKIRMRAYYRKKNGLPEAPYPAPTNCENCSRVFKSGHDCHLDHDHVTGKFRGWLCNKCNRGLGYLGDTIEGLKQALRYLERADERNK